MLGFGELQLNHGPPGEPSWLERVGPQLTDLPANPDRIDEGDPLLRDVLGYLTGNCVHCHNGSGVGPNSVFDLRHPVAVANLVSRPTESSASAAGIRVVPGHPEQSVLVSGFAREDTDVKPMPPVGVQRRDDAALTLFHSWISALPAAP